MCNCCAVNRDIRTVQSVIILKRPEPVVLPSDLRVDPVGLFPVHADELFERHKICQANRKAQTFPKRKGIWANIENSHQSCAHE